MKKLYNVYQSWSLKNKWLFTTSSIILLAFLLLCIVVYFAVRSWLLVGEQQRATRTIEDMNTFFLQEGIYIQNIEQYTGLLQSIIEQDEEVRIYNFDQVELIRINASAKGPAHVLSEEEIRAGASFFEDRTLIYYDVVQMGPFEGYIQLVHPLSQMYETLRYIVLTMLLLTILVVALTILGVHTLIDRLLQPIRALQQTMTNVRDKGFQAAEPLSYKAKDELGELVTIYEQMMEQLEKSFTQQQRFVSDASHELRTPIQAIEGHLSLVQRWGKDDPAVLEESIDTALTETRRMKHLMEELLKLAKDESVNEKPQANVEQVLQNVVSELQFVSKPFIYTQEIVGKKGLAYVTEQAAGQIFRNIIENSIRYSANNCTVHATIHYAESCIYVQLADNGIGIAGEHLPHIFDRFYRADAARQHIEGSAGLGLSITQALAQRYGIDIEVDSTLGKGTTFLLRFSLVSAH